MRRIQNLLKKLTPCLYFRLYVFIKTVQAWVYKDKSKKVIKDYKRKFNYILDLNNPKTFYEKINYLKLNWNNKLGSILVDKAKVKEYLSDLGYSSKITNQIAVFDSFNDFRKNINKIKKEHNDFVIKLTHTSGDIFFYHDGVWLNKKGYRTKQRFVYSDLKIKVKYNYYYSFFESVYKNVKGRILVENFIPSLNNKGLDEIKIFCNYGKPVLINYVVGRQNGINLKECFLYSDLRNTYAKQNQNMINIDKLEKPKCFGDIVKFCHDTVSSIPFVRVDLLLNKESFIFCEFTFFDCAGFNIFYPDKYNFEFGDLFDISSALINKTKANFKV